MRDRRRRASAGPGVARARGHWRQSAARLRRGTRGRYGSGSSGWRGLRSGRGGRTGGGRSGRTSRPRTCGTTVAVASPNAETGEPALTPFVLLGEQGVLYSPNTRTEGLVSNADVAPTLLAELGIDPPPGIQGRDAEVRPGTVEGVEQLASRLGFVAEKRSEVWAVVGIASRPGTRRGNLVERPSRLLRGYPRALGPTGGRAARRRTSRNQRPSRGRSGTLLSAGALSALSLRDFKHHVRRVGRGVSFNGGPRGGGRGGRGIFHALLRYGLQPGLRRPVLRYRQRVRGGSRRSPGHGPRGAFPNVLQATLPATLFSYRPGRSPRG